MRQVITLLLILTISEICFSQVLCDTISNGIFTVLENPAKPNLTDAELEEKLNNSIKPSLFDNYKVEYIYIYYIVNCKGESFNYKLYSRKDGKVKLDTVSDFQQHIISSMQSLLSFTPAIFKYRKGNKMVEKNVDFQSAYTMKISKNRIHILNEKEKKRHIKQTKKNK
jgi:hypothetical protein